MNVFNNATFYSRVDVHFVAAEGVVTISIGREGLRLAKVSWALAMIKNNLLVDLEKRELIESIQFPDEALWMKDFYLSKINKQLKTSQEKAQGLV